MEEEIQNAGRDNPTIFDYPASEIGGSIEELPAKVQLNITKSWNQFAEQATKMACGKYSLMHCINEEYKEENNPRDWRIKHNGSSGLIGSSIRDNLQDAIADGLIAGYGVCKNLQEVKQALARGNLIATGTCSCDWSKVKTDFMFHYTKGGAGHLICIEGYDDEKGVLIIRDSMGQDTPKRDKGRFYIKYEDLKHLYTCYEIYPIRYKNLIDNYKKMSDAELIKKIVDLGLMNGKDMEKGMTREQLAIVMGRLLTLVEGLLTSKKQ